MNKVVSIEIASQVFWIDEEAYEILKSYLQKIKQQLVDDECADDIYTDIELRIAELLFELKSDEKKAVTLAQLDEVIEQVGFIDSESSDETIPRKSYRDPQNKILGGVCAGLATRLGVPAFILRLIFISLTALFGLGVVLYLIFWISLDTSSNRTSGLAAQGKAQTAKQIATFEAPKESPLIQLQRIIFLPISIIGTLLTVIGSHLKRRRKGYVFIMKNIIGIVLLLLTLLFSVGLFEFNQSRLFYRTISWLLSAAAIYLVMLILFIYFKDYYLAKPEFKTVKTKIDKRLKIGAAISIVMIISAISFLHYSHLKHESKLVEKSFVLNSGELDIEFKEHDKLEKFVEHVSFDVKTHDMSNNRVNLYIQYFSSGKNHENAVENIQSINYFYTYENGTLKLDEFWTLKEDLLFRGQHISVTIEVPQNIMVTSSLPLQVRLYNHSYQYFARHYKKWSDKSENTTYLSHGQYLHEFGEDFRNKLSENEREILNDKFCEEFFISESWGCVYNINWPVSENSRFDRAFQNDIERINQIREYLLPDRSLFVSSLTDINSLVSELSIEYPVKSKFQEYVEHLLKVKSTASPVLPAKLQMSAEIETYR
ncbi:PspC domain-containing protein [Aliikangiella coralliicola]|uniref:PspC domain-containing protein n=1 Tax=Aliikangiella coralliicola TaxID=2592383 RepID=UPI00143CD426|nr:PspC domain-containing protein [Aliikangiella coralliicola]